ALPIFQAVLPAVAAGGGQGHAAGGLHTHVAGAVVGGEGFERRRGSRRAGNGQQGGTGGCLERASEQGRGVHGHCIPWYSIRRRSTASSPFSRWRMRTGVGTPSAIQKMVSSLPPLVRSTRMAS